MKTFTFLLSFLLTVNLIAQSETIPTDEGDIVLTPIMHSTMALEWEGTTIFVDPYGGSKKFADFGEPDLILITDIHGDHLNKETLDGLELSRAELIAPQAVIDELGDLNFGKTWALANGETVDWQSIKVEAIPMYNLPETKESRHPKGRGNGYVLTIGGKRIYLSGDTEDIPEMRALKNIDVAFICMNMPYTMEVEQAADAVLEFKPAVVYPFHYRGKGGFSDVEKFKRLVQKGNKSIDVRLLEWYPAN